VTVDNPHRLPVLARIWHASENTDLAIAPGFMA